MLITPCIPHMLKRCFPSMRRGSTTSRRTVRNVCDPQSVGIFCIKTSIHQIDRLLRSVVSSRSDHEPMWPHALQMRCTHQACNTFAADSNTMVITELRMNHRRSVRSVRAAVDRMNFAGQIQIVSRPRTRRSILPHVKTTGRYAEQPTHHLHRIGGLVGHHESEERFGISMFSRANQAAAFERISRSWRNCRTSCFSLVSSSRSKLVKP